MGSGDDKVTDDTLCHQLMIDCGNTVVVTGNSFNGAGMSKDGLSSAVPDLFQEWFNRNNQRGIYEYMGQFQPSDHAVHRVSR